MPGPHHAETSVLDTLIAEYFSAAVAIETARLRSKGVGSGKPRLARCGRWVRSRNEIEGTNKVVR